MAEQLRVFTALAEDLSSVPRTQHEQLTTTYNSSSKRSDALLWPPRTSALITTHNFKTQYFKRLSKVSREKRGLHTLDKPGGAWLLMSHLRHHYHFWLLSALWTLLKIL